MSRSTRIFIVDDAMANLPGSLSAARDMLAPMKDLQVESYSPLNAGYLKEGFNWHDYDILFLDGDLDRTRDYRCLKQFSQVQGFPYTIVFTNTDEPQEKVLLQGLGVAEIVHKPKLTESYLNTLVGRALLEISAGSFQRLPATALS